jgi:hypothetical protein
MSDTPSHFSAGPLRPNRRWRTPAVAFLAVAALAVGLVALRNRPGPATVRIETAANDQRAPASRAPEAPSPSSAPLPLEAATVTAPFAEAVVGRRLELTVLEVKGPDAKCITHQLEPSGAFPSFVGVYYTACTDWQKLNENIALFAVRIRNRSGASVPFRLRAFSILDRHGKRHVAIDVRDEAARPSSLIADTGSVRGHATVTGLIAFAFTGHGWLPGELDFKDGPQRLIIELSGPIRPLGRS